MRTNLYRHFDGDGALLYVGISLSAINRLSQHQNGSDWSQYISRVEIETFETRRDAEVAERDAIRNESPIFNITHNGGRKRYKGKIVSHKPTKQAPPERYRPPSEAGDEWLSRHEVSKILDPFNREPQSTVAPAAQRVITTYTGKTKGGEFFWRKSEVTAAIDRLRGMRADKREVRRAIMPVYVGAVYRAPVYAV